MKTGVIPAAGHGNRMGYLGKLLPKTLFPLQDRPILHHIIDNMMGVGIKEIYLIVNYQKELIEQYVKSVLDDFSLEIHIIEQKNLLGIADAIMQIERQIDDDSFLTILGDDCSICESLQNLVDSFNTNRQKGAVVLEGMVHENDQQVLENTNSVILLNDDRIVQIIEKPTSFITNIRGCGVYLFSDEVFEYIRKTPVSRVRGEIEISDTIDLLAKEGKAYGQFINGFNINVNSYDDLFKAWTLMKKIKIPMLDSIIAEKIDKTL